MTQATVSTPAVEVKIKEGKERTTCSVCPHFNNFHEPNGRGWCEQFNHQVREHHQTTNDCIIASDLLFSHELENNLALFPNVDFEKLEAFPTEEIESKLDQPYSEYEVGSIVKIIDAESDHTEWAVFEIVECRYNHGLYRSSESYVNEVAWYYRLASHNNDTTISKSSWIREDEICHFDLSHFICTEEIF